MHIPGLVLAKPGGENDGDLCDNCPIAMDGDGPLPDFNPANDGPDTDFAAFERILGEAR